MSDMFKASDSGKPDINCPNCRTTQLVYSVKNPLMGHSHIEKYSCSECGLIFLRDHSKYKLEKIDILRRIQREDYKGASLTIEQWQQIADGKPTRYDQKTGKYLHYVPDEWSECRPTFLPETSVPPTTEKIASNYGDILKVEGVEDIPQADGCDDSRVGAQRGRDIEQPVEVTLEEALTGTSRRISLTMEAACANCQGTGRIQKAICPICQGTGVVARLKKLELKIPAGVGSGSRVRFAGHGRAITGGNSDLILLITVLPGRGFKRDDKA
jgi:hypothetical protein